MFDDFGAGQDYWAVVTGCTDGIGKAMALQLADKKFNIIMLSRTPSKLAEMEKLIDEKGMRSKSYAVDFTKCTKEQWEDIKKLVNEERVSILINNVGLCHRNPIFFDDEDEKVCNDLVEVNSHKCKNARTV
ncbi:hypothetical protein GGI07_003223 [Coemansia sp. Benny D115]|nr:hypothetical protein GGI07_003223 [Coemansia sp. Benny D115]